VETLTGREPLNPPFKPDKQGAIVLGCGRSGTSAITRSLVKAGFFAGGEDELLGAAPSNETGHYEPVSVLHLNEELLRAQGSTWWAEVPEEVIGEQRRTAATPRIERILNDLLARADGAPIVIKEPRINGLLDLWGPIVEDSLHPVLVIRNPLEVAHSLARRDGNSIVNALATWEVQSSGSLRHLDRHVVTVVHYVEATRSAEAVTAVIDDVAAHLEPARATSLDAVRARDAVDPQLRNEDAGGIDLGEYLTGRQRQLWDYMRELPAGSTRLAVPEALLRAPEAARASVRSEGARLRALSELEAAREDGALLTERVGQVEAERDQAAAERDQAAAERDQSGDEKRAALRRAAETDSELARTQADLVESRRQLEDLVQSSSWRMTRHFRTLKHRLEELRRSRRTPG
jgi:hypothetical protein